MKLLRALEALGLLVGVVVGAGMFAMPQAVYGAGLGWSVPIFVIAALAIVLIHLLYGEIVWAAPARHRLPGFVRIYLGNWYYALSVAFRLITYYGTLLVYGVFAGVFLNDIFGGTFLRDPGYAFGISVIFFALSAPFLLFNLKKAGAFNLFFTALLVSFIVAFVYIAGFHIDASNFNVAGSRSWFLPYGIFLFAFAGASVIPELVDIFGRRDKRTFRKVLLFGTLIPALLYIGFVAVSVGVGGGGLNNYDNPFLAFGGALGGKILVVGSIIGFLSVLTSYFAMALELKYTYMYDLGRSEKLSAFLVVAPPLALFLFGINDFVKIVAVVGALGIGAEGGFILLLSRKMLHTRMSFVLALLAVLGAGAFFVVLNTLGLL